MSIHAKVIEIAADGSSKGDRGDYVFAALPSAGLRIVLWNGTGGLDIMETAYIEHSPTMAKPDTMAAKMAAEKGPRVRVYVRWLRMEC